MRLHKFENREIRSFRIRERALKLKAFFESNQRSACFIMSDAIQPQDRSESRDFLSHNGLQSSLLSKKVINLWMQQEQWYPIKELFKGNVIKIEPKCKTTGVNLPFTTDKLQSLVKQGTLPIRLFIENQKVYRETKLKLFLSRSLDGENFKESIITEKLKSPLAKGSYILNFLQLKGSYKQK